MELSQAITTEMVRTAIQSFCKGGKPVSNSQLYQIMGLQNEKEKDRVRARTNDMVATGEIVRIAPGVYEYNFKHRVRKNTSFPAIWRFVRMQKPGWSLAECCQLTRISYTQVKRYCEWLENENYIARYGKKGTSILYCTTEKASCTPETPYPDITDKNPFERENVAAAELARLMLCQDPYKLTTARKIVAACNVLLARFGKVIKSENETVGGAENV